jgi:PTH1 family peptidyl-tRNA hydrolase
MIFILLKFRFGKNNRDNIKAVVGLGNPGKKYSNTRHNIGFKVIEELGSRYVIEKEETKYDTIIGHIRIGNKKVLLVKPLTYMNLSGRAIKPVINWYKIDLNNLIVIYDDMDLSPGCIRIRADGGTGGHKGMMSVCESLGAKDFPRIRIGIGRAPEGVIPWVLGEFSDEEKIIINATVKKAGDAVDCWVKNGIAAAMNAYN